VKLPEESKNKLVLTIERASNGFSIEAQGEWLTSKELHIARDCNEAYAQFVDLMALWRDLWTPRKPPPARKDVKPNGPFR